MSTLDPSLERRGEGCSLWLNLQTGLALSVSSIYFYSKPTALSHLLSNTSVTTLQTRLVFLNCVSWFFHSQKV